MDYNIRVRTSQLQELKEYLKKIQVINIRQNGDIILKGDDAWDEIGSVPRPPQEGDTEGTVRPPKGGALDPWYFINFRTSINLKRRMENRAESDPTLLEKFDAMLDNLRVRPDGEPQEVEVERVFL